MSKNQKNSVQRDTVTLNARNFLDNLHKINNEARFGIEVLNNNIVYVFRGQPALQRSGLSGGIAKLSRDAIEFEKKLKEKFQEKDYTKSEVSKSQPNIKSTVYMESRIEISQELIDRYIFGAEQKQAKSTSNNKSHNDYPSSQKTALPNSLEPPVAPPISNHRSTMNSASESASKAPADHLFSPPIENKEEDETVKFGKSKLDRRRRGNQRGFPKDRRHENTGAVPTLEPVESSDKPPLRSNNESSIQHLAIQSVSKSLKKSQQSEQNDQKNILRDKSPQQSDDDIKNMVVNKVKSLFPAKQIELTSKSIIYDPGQFTLTIKFAKKDWASVYSAFNTENKSLDRKKSGKISKILGDLFTSQEKFKEKLETPNSLKTIYVDHEHKLVCLYYCYKESKPDETKSNCSQFTGEGISDNKREMRVAIPSSGSSNTTIHQQPVPQEKHKQKNRRQGKVVPSPASSNTKNNSKAISVKDFNRIIDKKYKTRLWYLCYLLPFLNPYRSLEIQALKKLGDAAKDKITCGDVEIALRKGSRRYQLFSSAEAKSNGTRTDKVIAALRDNMTATR